jgi:hypothetical protein
VALLALLPAPAAAADTYSLERGQAAFWSGPGPGAAGCGDNCFQYALDVRETAHQLRIGIDHATVGEAWMLHVQGPDGASDSVDTGAGLYSQELFFPDPAVGPWIVQVTGPAAAADVRFRLRAKLERKPVLPATPQLVPPNLQALPPYEFTFEYPVTNGTSDPPVGAPVPGGRTACHPEEVAEEAAQRCLRMAFGVRNTGQGPMSLFHEGATLEDAPLFQRVAVSDGSHVDRPAGMAKYHETHRHHHHDKAIGLTLWRVTDPVRGGLEQVGAEHLKGFAHRNELLREWSVFYPTHYEDTGFGLRAGWGDYYEWDRPGNYFDFALNPDGRYVVRIVADPVNGILESNEQDNTSYSMIDVALDSAALIESGRGSDPWDRCKIVMPFGAEPEPPPTIAQPPRPADCPPDTIDVAQPRADVACLRAKRALRRARRRTAARSTKKRLRAQRRAQRKVRRVC